MTKHKGAAADVVVSSESHRFGLSDRRLTILVLSACAFCGIATVQHLASIAAVMKRIRRSDAEAADFMRGDFFDFEPKFKLFIVGNILSLGI